MVRYIFFLIICISIIIVTAVTSTYYFHVGIDKQFSTSAQDWAQFGDYFGGVAGTLLAFISTVILSYTIYLQINQLSESQHESLKRDNLANVTKADDEISYWLSRKIPLSNNFKSEKVEFGDIVWGLTEPNKVQKEELIKCIIRLNKLVCFYCEALAVYRDNIDAYFIFKHHYQKAKSLLAFLDTNKSLLESSGIISIGLCLHILDDHGEG